MRRVVLLVVLVLALGVVLIAVTARDGEDGPAASSCRNTPVVAPSGTDADPELTIYEGESSRRLTPADWNSIGPSFSPGGHEIALVRADTGWGDGGPVATQLWIVPSTGDVSDARAVVAEPGRRTDPAWSPVGDTIAYVEWSESGDDRTLRLVDADGTDSRALVEVDDAYLYSPAWSPDATQIAYIEQRLIADSTASVDEIRMIDGSGGQSRKVAEIPGASNLSWSSDGNTILVSTYENEDGTLLLLDPADGSTTLVAGDATMGVLADDSTIYFLDRIEQGTWQLAVGNLEGGRLGPRTRLGNDRIYFYGFGLDTAPCGS